MAGKRHHHLWQMLQRGFSWRENSDDHVWVYRKGQPAKQTVTRKFGREKYFYGPEGSEADENITSFENSAQSEVLTWRSAPNGIVVDSAFAGELIAHLEMRTLFLRSEISRLSERMLNEIRGHIGSKTRLASMASSYLVNKPEVLQELLDDANIPVEQRESFLRFAEPHLASVITSRADAVSASAAEFLDKFAASISAVVVDAHNKALTAPFAISERKERHQHLSYRIVRDASDPFILPDTTLAFFTAHGCSPLSQKSDHIEAVVLPVSSAVVLVGMADHSFSRDIRTMQRALASCSFDAFLASKRCEDFRRLASRISKHTRLMRDTEIRKAAEAGFSKALKS